MLLDDVTHGKWVYEPVTDFISALPTEKENFVSHAICRMDSLSTADAFLMSQAKRLYMRLHSLRDIVNCYAERNMHDQEVVTLLNVIELHISAAINNTEKEYELVLSIQEETNND